MWPFTKSPKRGAAAQPRDGGPYAPKPQPVEQAEACPTTPCTTCKNPMPIVAFIQACPRCRTVIPPASSCPGGCGSCEMGAKPK